MNFTGANSSKLAGLIGVGFLALINSIKEKKRRIIAKIKTVLFLKLIESKYFKRINSPRIDIKIINLDHDLAGEDWSNIAKIVACKFPNPPEINSPKQITKTNVKSFGVLSSFFVNTTNNYVEAFIGIENIFKIIRLDYVVGYNNGKTGLNGFRLGLGGVIGGGIKMSNTGRNRSVNISL